VHFTVNLRGAGTYQDDFSYGLVFIPCPVWVQGKREVTNLNPENPHYTLGSIRKLMDKEGLAGTLKGEKTAIIIIHNVGHGYMRDLTALLEDLRSEGFAVKVYGQIDDGKQ